MVPRVAGSNPVCHPTFSIKFHNKSFIVLHILPFSYFLIEWFVVKLRKTRFFQVKRIFLNTVILLAAGISSRMSGQIDDKTLYRLKSIPVLAYSIEAFIESSTIEYLLIVVRSMHQKEQIESLIPFPSHLSVSFVQGGKERSESVYKALISCPKETKKVLIHDGARPFVKKSQIQSIVKKLDKYSAVSLASRVTDTIKITDSNKHHSNGFTLHDLDRTALWAMQTPQGFVYPKIVEAYKFITQKGIKVTDDVGAFQHLYPETYLVENLEPNLKITHPSDLSIAEYLIQSPRSLYN